MTNKKPNHSIRPQRKLNSQFKIIEKDLCANDVNEDEDLEVVNKWKEQVEKEQMGRSERDRVRDMEEEANGEGIESSEKAEEDGEASEDLQDPGDLRKMKKVIDPCRTYPCRNRGTRNDALAISKLVSTLCYGPGP